MSYRAVWSRRATKQLLDVPKKQRLMIAAWVEDHLDGCENPKAIAGGKHIQGTRNGWRYRCGSYRVLTRIEDEELLIEVVRVGHRQGVYSNLPEL